MMKYTFKLDVHKFARLLQTVIEQDTGHSLDYCRIEILIKNDNVHLFVPLYASNTGFVYDAPIADAFIKPINAEFDSENSMVFFVDNDVLKQMAKNYIKDTFYDVTVVVNRTTQYIKNTFTIVHVLNVKNFQELQCDVSVKDYRNAETAMLGLHINYMNAVRYSDAVQDIIYDALLELNNIYAELPFGKSATPNRFFILDKTHLYYCQGASCLCKKWISDPFYKLTEQGLLSISTDAVTFLKQYTNTPLYKMIRQKNGFTAIRTVIGNTCVGYVWQFRAEDVKHMRDLVEQNITCDLQNHILGIQITDLQRVSRSGLRKFAHKSDSITICCAGCAGSMINWTVLNSLNQDRYDKDNLVRDMWGLPHRGFQMSRLQAVVRLLQMYKVRQVYLSSKEPSNERESVTFSDSANRLCISLLPVCPNRR